jgi:hypothetical protein
MKKPELKVIGPPEVSPDDPKNVTGRLYDAVSKLLDGFDDMTVREQVAAVSAIARIQTLFPQIRETSGVSKRGSTVRQYEQAFKTNASGGRKSLPRSTIADDDDFDAELEH